MQTRATRSALLCAMICLGACGDDSGSEGEFGFATGPLMSPGEACSRCHGERSDDYPTAPRWALGGTVYPSADAAADEGVEGVSVVISAPDGTPFETLVTNSAGNFYTARTPPEGYRVALEYEGERIEMPCSPPSGGCANCHKNPPVGNATGRLYIPQGQTSELGQYASDTCAPL